MLKNLISKLVSVAFDKPLAPPTNREKELVSELKANFHGLSQLKMANLLPCEEAWLKNINRLRELVLNDDPREFLRWDVIVQTMFVTNARYVKIELNYLKNHPEWRSRWREAIKESTTGHPILYWRYPVSSGNLIHQAYCLAKFEEQNATHVNDMDFVLEFGGGYGGMCRLLHNLGFRGKYVIFDLPPFSALQQFYLKSTAILVRSVESFNNAENGVICLSDLEQMMDIIPVHIEGMDSMFIATWSISEVPMDLRESILSLTSKFKTFMIAYQHQFEKVNNIEFFRNWMDTRTDIEWCNWQLRHSPNNYYLVGKRRLL